MDLRSLETAQQAVPILLRHLSGYAELAEKDIAATKDAVESRLTAIAVLGASICFATLMLCALIIALTWDGEYRMTAIALLTGAFGLAAIGAFAWLKTHRHEPFEALRREWRRDREFLERMLSKHHTETSTAYSDSGTDSGDHDLGQRLMRNIYERARQ